MVRIREVILVEGKYDKNALLQVVDATVLETRGFGIFKDKAMQAYLRRVARENNLRILAGTADNRLYLVRSQILRFVNYYILTGNAPATDVGNRFQTQLVIVQQILHPLVDAALGRLVFAVRRFAH